MTIANPYDDPLFDSTGGEKKAKRFKPPCKEYWYAAQHPRRKEDFIMMLDWIDQHYGEERVAMVCTSGFHDYLRKYLQEEGSVYKYKDKILDVVAYARQEDEDWEHSRFSGEDNSHYLIQFI